MKIPRRIAGALIVAMLWSTAAPWPARAAELKPNVIVILADDLGSIDASCYGAKDLLREYVVSANPANAP